jgi:hypothetical protein
VIIPHSSLKTQAVVIQSRYLEPRDLGDVVPISQAKSVAIVGVKPKYLHEIGRRPVATAVHSWLGR